MLLVGVTFVFQALTAWGYVARMCAVQYAAILPCRNRWIRCKLPTRLKGISILPGLFAISQASFLRKIQVTWSLDSPQMVRRHIIFARCFCDFPANTPGSMVRILLCGDVRGDVPKVCRLAALASGEVDVCECPWQMYFCFPSCSNRRFGKGPSLQ